MLCDIEWQLGYASSYGALASPGAFMASRMHIGLRRRTGSPCLPVAGLVISVFVAIYVSISTTNSSAADNPFDPSKYAHSIVGIIAAKPNSIDSGSGFIVDADGTIATSYSLVQGAKVVTVVFVDGQRTTASGFTAARQGKGVVLLKVSNKPKDIVPLEFSHGPQKPEQLHLLLVAAPQPNFRYPQVEVGKAISGEDLRPTFPRKSTPMLPSDPEAIWLKVKIGANNGQPFLGSALVDKNGEVVGMLEGDYAIHASHIEHMLRQGKKAVRPFLALTNYVDQPDEAPLDTVSEIELGGSLAMRSQPLVERLKLFDERQAKRGVNRSSLRNHDLDLVNELIGLMDKYRDLDQQATANRRAKASINPEEKYEEKGPEGKDDKGSTYVTKYRFSARQLQQRAKLDSEFSQLTGEAQATLNRAAEDKDERAQIAKELDEWDTHPSPACYELLGELDLTGLAEPAEHEAAIDWLTNRLATATPEEQGMYRFARTLSYRRLGNNEKARVDFEDAVKADAPDHVGIQTALACFLIEHGDKVGGGALFRRIPSGNKDGISQLFRALDECSSGNFHSAQQRFEKSLELGVDKADTHRLAALAYATATAKADRNGPKALVHAQHACEMTYWKHWPSLIALAAAQAEAGQKEQAAKTALRAVNLAEGANQTRCQHWADDLKAGKPLAIDWK